MARERSNFETYSMFYENILRQQQQLLYQKEQVFPLQLMFMLEKKQCNCIALLCPECYLYGLPSNVMVRGRDF